METPTPPLRFALAASHPPSAVAFSDAADLPHRGCASSRRRPLFLENAFSCRRTATAMTTACTAAREMFRNTEATAPARPRRVQAPPTMAGAASRQARPPRLKVRFLKLTRDSTVDEATARAAALRLNGSATIFFDTCGGTAWADTSFGDLTEFVSTSSVTLALRLDGVGRSSMHLYTHLDESAAPLPAPIYISSEGSWRQVLEKWRTGSTSKKTVVIELPSYSDAHRAYSADLALLQHGAHEACRTERSSQAAARELNNALYDDAQLRTADDACRQLMRLPELLKWRGLADELARVFGTERCFPHPGAFYCWCGTYSSFEHCTTVIRVNYFGDLAQFNRHLQRACRFDGAPQVAKRLAEWWHYGGVTTTPLPRNMPEIVVPPRLILNFRPNLLSDGTPLDLNLCLLNGLIQRDNLGRQGGLRSSHLVRQIGASFVAPFYGLENAESRDWGRYLTLCSFAETIHHFSPRGHALMFRNGLIGSRPREETKEDDRDADDDDDDDDNDEGRRNGGSGVRLKKRTILGKMKIGEVDIEETEYRFAGWSSVASFDATVSQHPISVQSMPTLPAGITAVLVSFHRNDSVGNIAEAALRAQRLGARALAVQASADDMREYGSTICGFTTGAVVAIPVVLFDRDKKPPVVATATQFRMEFELSPSILIDPHEVNMIGPHKSAIRRMSLPIPTTSGVYHDYVIAFLRTALHKHLEEPEKKIFIVTNDSAGNIMPLNDPFTVVDG